ncbi:MAG: hypothetical protein JSW38_01875 [Dehalococcoidia bacterium]|nr:MAG: hypothetical protein JSW38_01875 [Dehalococcoidia bacterium]
MLLICILLHRGRNGGILIDILQENVAFYLDNVNVYIESGALVGFHCVAHYETSFNYVRIGIAFQH